MINLLRCPNNRISAERKLQYLHVQFRQQMMVQPIQMLLPKQLSQQYLQAETKYDGIKGREDSS